MRRDPRRGLEFIVRAVPNAELRAKAATQPPTSWWAQPSVQASRVAFAYKAAKELPRMQTSRFGQATIDPVDGGRPPLYAGAKIGL